MRSNVAQKQNKCRYGLEVTVMERNNEPGVWMVEAIDAAGDGSIYQAIFVGPQAHARAAEYARVEYGI